MKHTFTLDSPLVLRPGERITARVDLVRADGTVLLGPLVRFDEPASNTTRYVESISVEFCEASADVYDERARLLSLKQLLDKEG